MVGLLRPLVEHNTVDTLQGFEVWLLLRPLVEQDTVDMLQGFEVWLYFFYIRANVEYNMFIVSIVSFKKKNKS